MPTSTPSDNESTPRPDGPNDLPLGEEGGGQEDSIEHRREIADRDDDLDASHHHGGLEERREKPDAEQAPTPEHARLAESPTDSDPWRLWGPYVAARQWGTVREDYSADGDAWSYFPFDDAHRRAYRWGDDGIAGLCDRYGFLNFSLALWNGQDDRLKERWFGLSNPEGNHGEDVKDYWWHLDATPTHSWAQLLYRYPQAAFPYEELRRVNAERGLTDLEYELGETGVFDEDRFFDVVVTHAKAGPEDICVTIEATNHGPEAAPLDLVPQLWFRNTWAWGLDDRVPTIRRLTPDELPVNAEGVKASHGFLGDYVLVGEGEPELLFCDNDTDAVAIWGSGENRSPYPKNGLDTAIVHGDRSQVNPEQTGTKVGFRYHFDAVGPGETVSVRLRLHEGIPVKRPFGKGFAATVDQRRRDADAFFDHVIPAATSDDDRLTARRAFAGLAWGKQHYRYAVQRWLEGDPAVPSPPERNRANARNADWRHLYLADVISMPDEWEFPWFASWDLAFHCVALAHVDPAFAKNQLLLMCREWTQHPSGALPAYEWAFDDVNPPVHAWAVWQVFALEGGWDREFLVRVFTKLLINFTRWVNRKDEDESNLFEGGFLGMDNIGVFDRSRQVPAGYRLEQSDATSWMAFYCLSMLHISLELARLDPAWDDLCTLFLERFVAISRALNNFGHSNVQLWSEDDDFFHDSLVSMTDGSSQLVPVRSLVGLLPIMAVTTLPDWVDEALPQFTERMHWLSRNVPSDAEAVIDLSEWGQRDVTLSLLRPERLEKILQRLFDESEFLSSYGIRSLSAAYRDGWSFNLLDTEMSISYDPGESTSHMFGGNSNWRGPIWMPINVLLIDALETYAQGLCRDLRVEIPFGGGEEAVSLTTATATVRDRLVSLFRPDADGKRPSDQHGTPTGPLWDHPTFSEHFHGDTGRGLGASHQTGWTALVAHLIVTAPEK